MAMRAGTIGLVEKHGETLLASPMAKDSDQVAYIPADARRALPRCLPAIEADSEMTYGHW